MASDTIRSRMDALDLSQSDLARAIGLTPDKVNKVFAGTRQWRGQELLRVNELLDRLEREGGYRKLPDQPEGDPLRDYLAVQVLPSYAGMGGGGSGEGDVEMGMVPRRLIEDELRAKVTDVLLLEARGSSMEPDFQHGDQILIDKRDTNPVQPGAFALWDGDGYVIKLIEKVPRSEGVLRIFSANERFAAYEVPVEEIRIMGRPVWFARRL